MKFLKKTAMYHIYIIIKNVDSKTSKINWGLAFVLVFAFSGFFGCTKQETRTVQHYQHFNEFRPKTYFLHFDNDGFLINHSDLFLVLEDINSPSQPTQEVYLLNGQASQACRFFSKGQIKFDQYQSEMKEVRKSLLNLTNSLPSIDNYEE